MRAFPERKEVLLIPEQKKLIKEIIRRSTDEWGIPLYQNESVFIRASINEKIRGEMIKLSRIRKIRGRKNESLRFDD